MTVQVAQPNFGGLGLAQGNTNLNLQPVGALGLQAIQTATANANARKQAELEQQRLGQQFVLQSQQQNILREQMAQQAAAQAAQQQMDQQKMGMAGQQFGAELDYKNRALAQQGMMAQNENELKQAALAQEYQQKQMARLMDMDKQSLKDRGAMASYGLLALKNAKTPEEAAMIRSEWLKEAKSKKMVSDEEAELLAKSPLSKVQNLLMYDVLRTGQASEMKQVMDAMAPPKESKGDVSLSIDPETGKLEYSSKATQTVQGQAQKELMAATDNEKELRQMLSSIPDRYFGPKAASQSITGAREWLSGVPGLSGVKPSDEALVDRQEYEAAQGQVKNLAMNIIRQQSGLNYTDSQLEFMKQILPEIGPWTVRSSFEGRSQNLLRFLDQVKRDRAEILRKGFNVTSVNELSKDQKQQYESELLNRMQSTSRSIIKGRDPVTISNMKSAGYSDEEIDAYYAKKEKK